MQVKECFLKYLVNNPIWKIERIYAAAPMITKYIDSIPALEEKSGSFGFDRTSINSPRTKPLIGKQIPFASVKINPA